MKKVNIRQGILDAIDQTDPSLMRFEAQMMKWSRWVEKSIGSKNAYPRAGKAYELTGSVIELPDNSLQVLAVLIGDYEEDLNAIYRTVYGTQIQTTTQTDYLDGRDIDYIWQSLNATLVPETFWEQVGNELNLISEYTETTITVIYTHLEKNDQGYYIVNESHIDAISKYIIYMFSKKNLWRIFKSEKLLRASSIELSKEYKRDYHAAVRNARAEDGAETPFETEQY